jgi:hypothetical protein
VNLPFTPDQFFGVFAAYNRAFWLVAVVLWFASAATAAFVWRDPPARSRVQTHFLGILWMWNALAYHAFLFTRINPAAWLFAGLFAAQAVLFFRTRSRVEYFSRTAPLRWFGLGLACYALAYPILNLVLGHEYPASPTFGVPCPTAIFTIGMLLTARGGLPLALSVIPAIWGLVGGSAAVVLDVPADYVLLGAGVLLTVLLINRRTERRTGS